MANKRNISNLLALAVLGLLAERPTHPYEMDFLMRSRGLTESIKLNRGSLYTVVEMLQREGLIVTQEVQREGRRPERTVYALTEAGRAKFASWHRDLMSKPAKEYSQFAAALAFIGHLAPSEAVALLEMRAGRLDAEIEARRFRLDATEQRLSVPRLFLLEEDFALSQQEAEVRWVRQIIGEIADGTLAWPTYLTSEHTPVSADQDGARDGTETAEGAMEPERGKEQGS